MKTNSKASVKTGKAKIISGKIGARRPGNARVLYPASLVNIIADAAIFADSMICT